MSLARNAPGRSPYPRRWWLPPRRGAHHSVAAGTAPARLPRCRPEVRMGTVELPHFPLGAPAEVTLPGVPKMRVGYRVEVTCDVEPCGELVRETLVVDEALLAPQSDGFLVEAFGVQEAPFDACDFGGS